METIHQIGDRIAERYLILNLLGRGGIGITYKAEDLQLKQQVAIKAVSFKQIDNWKTLELFEREAKTLASLAHPAIPKYLNYFYLETTDNLTFYLVQELIQGNCLASLIDKGWRIEEKIVKQIAIQILKILDYLHKLNPPVIHRDIKPQNIIIDANNKVYLVDFGAVQNVYRHPKSYSTTCVGTFGYMPPEQFRGQTFFASDLYSLGATILFLLTHRSPAELPQKRMKIDFRQRISVSEEFANWLEKMLEPAIEDRFHSAAEALKSIQNKDRNNPSLTQNNLPNKSIFTNISKPFDSKIVFQRTETTLRIKIPAAGFKIRNISVLISGIFVYCSIFLFNLELFSGNLGIDRNLLGFIFFLAINLSGIYYTLSLLWNIFGYVTIQIEPKIFWITKRLFKFKSRYCGQTINIQQVEVIRDRDSEGNIKRYCALWNGTKKYTFGNNLTSIEQGWLVDEMLDFLSHTTDLMY